MSSSTLKSSGGEWGTAKPETDLERIIRRAAETPGPGLSLPSTLNSRGGKFNLSVPKSHLELLQLRSAETPGPGKYTVPSFDPKSLAGGKFNVSLIRLPH